VAKPEDYPHSSYRSYVLKSKEDFVYPNLILEMISKNRKDAPKKYRDFVEKAIGERLENPLANVYGGAILGGKTFIKQALDKLKDGILQGEEISNRKQLQAAYESDDVIEAISDYFNVSPDDVSKNSSESRNIAIYLMKKFTGMTNRQIGELFGDLSYSAVAKAHQRLSTKLKKDRSLRKRFQEITSNLS